MNYREQYLLDTDMCIYLLNGQQQVKAYVAEVGITALAVALPTVGELYFGVYNSERVAANIARVRAFLASPGPQVLPIDTLVAEHFGRFKALLRRQGQPIAGIAVRYELTVMTNNTSHFERIQGSPWQIGSSLPRYSHK